MRKVRATFLLRCVILAGCVAAFLGMLFLGMGVGWTVGTLAFAALMWVVGIEVGLLPLAIEYVVVRRRARSGESVSSIWFVNLDRQRQLDAKRFDHDTRDNPTIR